jgi:hypothetical protein
VDMSVDEVHAGFVSLTGTSCMLTNASNAEFSEYGI